MSDPDSNPPLEAWLMRRVVPPLVLALLWLLSISWRYRETGREQLDAAIARGEGVVGAFLHGRTFALLRFMSRPHNGRWIAMCSKSLDGEAMARVERGLGFEVVRGSSGRDGLEALVEMIERVRADRGLGSCLAIDGSRGPRGHAQAGIVSLAQRTGRSILPITASARPAFVFRKSWDRTMLPLPFARVEIVYGEPIEVPARLSRDEREGYRAELERRILELQLRADGLSGWSDQEPVQAPLHEKSA